MEKIEIDNIDPNKAFHLFKLHEAILIDGIADHKTYQGHILSFSVSRIPERLNLG